MSSVCAPLQLARTAIGTQHLNPQIKEPLPNISSVTSQEPFIVCMFTTSPSCDIKSASNAQIKEPIPNIKSVTSSTECTSLSSLCYMFLASNAQTKEPIPNATSMTSEEPYIKCTSTTISNSRMSPALKAQIKEPIPRTQLETENLQQYTMYIICVLHVCI